MTNVELGLTITIAVQLSGALIGAVRKEGDLRVVNEKIKNMELITDHLTRAGEGIKEELSTLKSDIKNINTNIEFIKEALKNIAK